MNKKIFSVGLFFIMLVAATPAYAISLNSNNEAKSSVKELSSGSDGSELYEDIDIVIENANMPVVLNKNNSENQTGYETGWLKIETIGKGLTVFYEIPVFKISHSLPTLQYKDFNPFMMSYYLTYIVYNDENASTNITNTRTGNVTHINGSHSLVTGYFGSMSLRFLGWLVRDGLIDGLGYNWIDNLVNIHPFGNLLQNIVNKLPGFPIVNMTNLSNFLEPFMFGPFNWNGEPTFNTPFISEMREEISERISNINIPIVRGIMNGLFSLGVSIGTNVLAFAPWMFIPKWLPRVQILNFIEPSYKIDQASGYGVFAYWNENPKQERLDKIENFQNILNNGMMKIDRFLENRFEKFVEES